MASRNGGVIRRGIGIDMNARGNARGFTGDFPRGDNATRHEIIARARICILRTHGDATPPPPSRSVFLSLSRTNGALLDNWLHVDVTKRKSPPNARIFVVGQSGFWTIATTACLFIIYRAGDFIIAPIIIIIIIVIRRDYARDEILIVINGKTWLNDICSSCWMRMREISRGFSSTCVSVIARVRNWIKIKRPGKMKVKERDK